MDFDLIVIGDVREGLDRAISVAQSGGRAAVIGSAESTPTLEMLRHAANNVVQNGNVTLATWNGEIARLSRLQALVTDAELESAGVERISGSARFVSSNSVEIRDGNDWRIVSASQFVIACGTRSWRPDSLRLDDRFVFSVESIHQMRDVQRSVIVIGAGEAGTAAAIVLATLGLEVVVVDEHSSLMKVSDVLTGTFDATSSVNIAFRLGEEVIGTEIRPNLRATVRLASGKILVADAVLACVGLEGKTQGLNLEGVGVGLDERGRVWCDTEGKTWNPSISAVGDVVGFPQTAGSPKVDIQAQEALNCERRLSMTI